MKEVLKYQEIDSKLRQAKNKLSTNENRKKASMMQEFLKESQNKLVELDGKAGAATKSLDQLKKDYDLICKKLESFDSGNGSLDVLAKLGEQLSKTERDIAVLQGKFININKEFESLMKNAKNAKSNLVFYKEQFDKVKEQAEPEISALESELAAQKGKVKPELLAKYNNKAEGKSFPIFVPLKDGHCAGCRMEIPAGKLKDAHSAGFVECENCGRYVYIEN